jgi:adenosylcobinamide-GDP ribazoletransferase
MVHYLRTRLGGYTGDCLGAVQQLSEITLYLTLLVAASSGH